MIVVFVELWPGGDQSKAKPIGSLALSNVTNDPDALLDSYLFEMDEAENKALNIARTQTTRRLDGYNRKQSVWKLIRRAIDSVFPPTLKVS